MFERRVAVPFTKDLPDGQFVVVGEGVDNQFLEDRPQVTVMGEGFGVRSVPQEDLVETTFEQAFHVFADKLRFNDKGLIPTVVVDAQQKLLGQVFSTIESIYQAVGQQKGIYYSRSRDKMWVKGEESGNTQKLLQVRSDCDGDALVFVVEQQGNFCHLEQKCCFGDVPLTGLSKLDQTLKQRVKNPTGYTARLLNDPSMLAAKILEEAQELVDADDKDHVAEEMADLIYFGLVKCASAGVSLKDVETILDKRSKMVFKRPGDAKAQFMQMVQPNIVKSLELQVQDLQSLTKGQYDKLLKRPIQDMEDMTAKVKPILDNVRRNGDRALIEYTMKFDKVELQNTVMVAPFKVPDIEINLKRAIDQAYSNIKKFHEAQKSESIQVETMPGVVCSRFARTISSVGLYVPGGSAILPSTAMMLGVAAQVAGVERIVLATPPNKHGKVAPEILYIASLVGASQILVAGGAQAVAAFAYGTESLQKVDKICGPGNQYVTAAKLYVSCDTQACVSIDMPAGPSEVLVIADSTSVPAFVASDLLSQAEHGPDSQVVLLTVGLTVEHLSLIQEEIKKQAVLLSRLSIIKQCLAKSFCLRMDTVEEALKFSNDYAPEHLILHLDQAEQYIGNIQNAGSVFVGPYSPESVGDYASGTNHTLPTYAYARQYSGVGVDTFQKWITSQQLTKEGLKNISSTVVKLAECEQLDAHANAVLQRLQKL